MQEKGGILVTDEELKAAFDFFDVQGTGKITLPNLKVRPPCCCGWRPERGWLTRGQRRHSAFPHARSELPRWA